MKKIPERNEIAQKDKWAIEDLYGMVRVSLRSVDDFPCNRMAEEFFNGGGHLNAAGGELACTMDEAVERVRVALKKYTPLLAVKTK